MYEIDAACVNKQWETADVNTKRVMMERVGISNNDMAGSIFNMVNKVYPWRLW